MVSRVIVKLPHQTSPKGDHIPHEKKYNTRHGLSAIPNEVHREIRREPRQPEVQQEPVVYLFLEAALGWKCGIPGLPCPPLHRLIHGAGSEALHLTRRTPLADSPGNMPGGSVRSGLSGFLLQQGRRRDDGQYRLCHHAGIRPYRNDIHQPRQAAGNARHLYHPPPGLEERQ